MFVTENQNIADSVLFLLSARTALANVVEESNLKEKDELVNFLFNEASDYEIMHLLVTNEMPDEKFNEVAEQYLFSILKEQMLRNSNVITEAIGEDIFNNVLYEVDSVFPDLSTTTPVLEFYGHQYRDVATAVFLSELDWDTGVKKVKNFITRARTGNFKSYAQSKYKGTGGPHPSPTAHISKKNLGPGGYNAPKPTAHISKKNLGPGPHAKAKTPPLDQLKKMANQGLDRLANFAKTPAGQGVGGAALAALLIYAAVKIYKRFFSQAAKSCAKLPSKAKTACMKKYRKQAILKQAAALSAGASACSSTKSPEKCKAAVRRKVERLKAKAQKIAA